MENVYVITVFCMYGDHGEVPSAISCFPIKSFKNYDDAFAYAVDHKFDYCDESHSSYKIDFNGEEDTFWSCIPNKYAIRLLYEQGYEYELIYLNIDEIELKD